MKKIFSIERILIAAAIASTVIMLICLLSAFTILINSEHSKAIVTQREGIYIFIAATPEADFDVIGSVKVGAVVMSGKNDDLLNTLIKKARKEYPTAEGVMMNDVNFDHCDVIKFK